MPGLSFPNIYQFSKIASLKLFSDSFGNLSTKYITQVNVSYNLYQLQLLRLSVAFQLLTKTMNFLWSFGVKLSLRREYQL